LTGLFVLFIAALAAAAALIIATVASAQEAPAPPAPPSTESTLLAGRGIDDPDPTDEEPFKPIFLPTLEVRRSAGAIHIDGELNDAGWADAATTRHFTETRPGDQTQPPVETEAFITYDDANLYLGFIAHDDPSSIRSSLRARDEIFQEDYIGIIFDTFGDAEWQYELFCNPIGIQGDLRATRNDEDANFNIVWESEGKITEQGYQVEMSIPFSSLRFPNTEEQTWRVNFWRNHPRDSRRQYSWAAINRDNPCFPCQFGTVTGISGVKPSNDLELLPAFVGFQSGALRDDDDPASGFDNAPIEGEGSLGMRYALTSSLAGEAAINPDFSQIESDAAQIDVNSTLALFYPEKRPFFQDGSNLFESWIDAVYTRSINDPSVTAKLTGQVGRTSVAYVGAIDEHSPFILPFEERSEILLAGRSTSNIVRMKQTLMDDSFVGVLATDRRLEGGGSGSVYGADGSLRLFRNYSVEVQGLVSRTHEPVDAALTEDLGDETFDDGKHTSAFDGEDFTGTGLYASLERNARVWNVNFDYIALNPTFRADNGFVTQNDRRTVDFWTGLFFRRDRGFVEAIEPSVNVGRVWNYRDVFKDEWLRPQVYAQLKGQTQVTLSYLLSRERFEGTVFPGIRIFMVNANTNASKLISGGMSFNTGWTIARNIETPVLGYGTNASVWTDIKPVNRLVISPNFSYSKLDHPDDSNIFEGYVLRTRLNYQFTRELFTRVVFQYDQFDQAYSLEPLVSYVVNPFTVFYLGSTHAYTDFDGHNALTQTSRQFFLKLQYLFRV
jgi:hypothetical protein